MFIINDNNTFKQLYNGPHEAKSTAPEGFSVTVRNVDISVKEQNPGVRDNSFIPKTEEKQNADHKPDVQFLIMTKDIEGYNLEASRAGRDGEPADRVLFYSGQDVRTNLWLIENARESKESDDELLSEQVLERDRARPHDMTFTVPQTTVCADIN